MMNGNVQKRLGKLETAIGQQEPPIDYPVSVVEEADAVMLTGFTPERMNEWEECQRKGVPMVLTCEEAEALSKARRVYEGYEASLKAVQ